MKDHLKENLIKFGKVLLIALFAMLLIITCAAVWNAAAGAIPTTFYIVSSVLHFIAGAVSLAFAIKFIMKGGSK